MINEKIPHANWKFIERKSETFIPMALVVERSSLGCINPEWNGTERSYFHWIIICVCK